ncbi:Periplasmic binding protein/LacI transcriptional regulator [Sulfitobacter noctilucicola]|uniref:DNA-binding LacI/PurR family transcriptional regulator n=1 Tax=Sulfitobacter noctilucicola TaxID=1342301 RepID=A0A7W6M8X5_9RHOB|nr:LacI family DNA-binding transcriptional regulator [Sulfitobacter noctilucicola]KIN64232.1 Periplasmic binding protein/LacI transcriptional regulator [Sulfitobacter noctilucicola]MBB4174600.1 DNA-binding LacI/PurR family transcriptional regulator [Sulfitobacter noctilucicola]
MPKPLIKTMEELSVAIGVSRPTLSRFFQDPTSVKATTVARIERGLSQVEYVPNFFATRLNRKSTGIIGVIIPYLNDLFFTKLLEGIEAAAMEAGLTVITQCSHSDPAIEARAAETFMSMNMDGALVAPLGDHSDWSVHLRLKSRLPFVLMDSRPRTMPDVDFVGTNHRQSTGLITEYLCRVGDPPVFLAMPRVNFNALEREAAYIEQMEELGFEPRVIGTELIGEDWHFEEHGAAVLGDEFARGRLTESSILCANDRVAIGALHAASRHGLKPGRAEFGGLRIAGHDDYPLCPYMNPALTTVAQDTDAIGQKAVSRLLQIINGGGEAGAPELTLFDGTLKLRDSA